MAGMRGVRHDCALRCAKTSNGENRNPAAAPIKRLVRRAMRRNIPASGGPQKMHPNDAW